VNQIYQADFPEVAQNSAAVAESLDKEEKIFRQTLRSGLVVFNKLTHMEVGQIQDGKKINVEHQKLNFPVPISGRMIFKLYDTYGFPVDLSLEEVKKNNMALRDDWQKEFDAEMAQQREKSQTAAQGMFRGGLADHSEEVVKLHTVTHLMYQALKNVLGSQVVQRGSNITAERTRFDFSYPEKMTPEQLKQVEDIVNQKIAEDLPVSWQEEDTKEAFAKGASGAFGDKYGDKVKVYTIGDPANPFSREICGGPHVEHTGQIGEGGKHFKVTKEESSSAGVRRIKAVLQ
jgi:alanyl-tRNA synthetase